MCEHFEFISQNNRVGKHFITIDHLGLDDVILFVLQFGRKDSDSEELLVIRLILELMWIHGLMSTTLLGLNVFRLENDVATSHTILGHFCCNPCSPATSS